MKFNVHPLSVVLGAGCALPAGALFGFLLARGKFQRVLNEEVDELRTHYHSNLQAVMAGFANRDGADRESSVGTDDGEDGTVQSDVQQDEHEDDLEWLVDPDEDAEAQSDDSPVSAASGREPGTDYRSRYKSGTRVIKDTKPSLDDAVVLAGFVPGTEGNDGEPGIDTSKPFVIPYEEFFEDPEADDLHYDKISITYFTKDKVLVDDKDVPIPDIEKAIGKGNLGRFGDRSKDPEIVFIRNPKLQVDFEVTKDERGYAEHVLGYGNVQGQRYLRETQGS